MCDQISIAKYWKNEKEVNVTIKDYSKMVKSKDKSSITKMVYHRFYERYIKPFEFDDPDFKKFYKNGFAMMASGCLLIESLESFYNGLETTIDKGKKTFNSFFHRSNNLKKFESIEFYKHIRCGIYHQAETTGGYKISRSGPLLDNKKKIINTYKFHKELDICLKEYIARLDKEKWDSEIWDNFRRKMRFVIEHCKN